MAGGALHFWAAIYKRPDPHPPQARTMEIQQETIHSRKKHAQPEQSVAQRVEERKEQVLRPISPPPSPRKPKPVRTLPHIRPGSPAFRFTSPSPHSARGEETPLSPPPYTLFRTPSPGARRHAEFSEPHPSTLELPSLAEKE